MESYFLRRHYPDRFDGRRLRQPNLSPCKGTRVDEKNTNTSASFSITSCDVLSRF